MATQRAAIYCRVSDPKQESNTSLKEQQDGCAQWCQERGYGLAPEHIYVEVGQGDDYFTRPAFTALRIAIRRQEIDVAVFFRVDRAVQRGGLRHWHAFQMEALEHGVTLECVTEPDRNLNAGASLDDESDQDEMEEFRQVLESFKAKKEKQDLIARTSGGRRQRALAGKLIPGNLPKFGYRWADADGSGRGSTRKVAYSVDPDTAPIVRRIYDLAAAGLSVRRIVDLLNADGVPCPTAAHAAQQALTEKHAAHLERSATGRWARTTVRRILFDDAYRGDAVVFRQRVRRLKERDPETGTWRARMVRVDRPVDDPVRIALPAGAVPRLLDDSLITRARANLAAYRDERQGHPTDPDAGLLRGGFAKCGYCGGNLAYLAHGGHGGVGAVYKCSVFTSDKRRCPHGHTIGADKLDALVWRAVTRVLTSPAEFRQRLAGLERMGADAQARQAQAVVRSETALRDLAARRSNRLDRLERATNPSEVADIEARLDKLAVEIQARQADHAEALNETEETSASLAEIEAFEAWAATEAGHLDSLTRAEKRARLRKMGVQVTLWHVGHLPHRVEIAFFAGIAHTAQRIITWAHAYNAAHNIVNPKLEEALAVVAASNDSLLWGYQGRMGGGVKPSSSQSDPADQPVDATTSRLVLPAGAADEPPREITETSIHGVLCRSMVLPTSSPARGRACGVPMRRAMSESVPPAWK